MSGLIEDSWILKSVSISCQRDDVTTRHVASGKLLVHLWENESEKEC